MRQPGSPPPRRAAFTVLELLVVIAIIAIIISLTVAAVAAIIGAQERKTTELTIKRIDEGLKAHMRGVLDQAKELPVPASVMNLAGGDPIRAKVIWQKLQLKRLFPMTFREALYPWAVDGNNASPSPISATDLPPVDAYVKAVNAVVLATGSYAPVGTYDPDESSHLLFLALSVNRRGVDFNIEQALEPLAIYQDAPNKGSLRGVNDAWSIVPICFFRWPTDFPDYLGTVNDLQDPQKRLMDANWNNSTMYNGPGPILGRNGVYWFEQLCHLVHDPTASTWTQGRPFYAPATIVSGGPNKKLGFLRVLDPSSPGMALIPEILLPAYPAFTPNFGMAPVNASDNKPTDSNDNIYSTTLK